ncbi:unnamed protein product [Nesidiocoris tenuis]|uniref:Uncharacterized protein n=1 Tax=Nesidiocoris tenuis TaxID=355587 RepID=A0A6H5G5I7_9HEMI|nr:unnamed protein product [Nesidiocoris tenuis]
MLIIVVEQRKDSPEEMLLCHSWARGLSPTHPLFEHESTDPTQKSTNSRAARGDPLVNYYDCSFSSLRSIRSGPSNTVRRITNFHFPESRNVPASYL